MYFTDFLPHITERLILRRFIDNDIDRFLSYRHDSQVARYQSWSILSRNEAELFVDGCRGFRVVSFAPGIL